MLTKEKAIRFSGSYHYRVDLVGVKSEFESSQGRHTLKNVIDSTQDDQHFLIVGLDGDWYTLKEWTDKLKERGNKKGVVSLTFERRPSQRLTIRMAKNNFDHWHSVMTEYQKMDLEEKKTC